MEVTRTMVEDLTARGHDARRRVGHREGVDALHAKRRVPARLHVGSLVCVARFVGLAVLLILALGCSGVPQDERCAHLIVSHRQRWVREKITNFGEGRRTARAR